MFMYVSLALVVITVLFVLFNLIKGLIRGFKKTIGSLVAIILSAIIAFIAAGFICDPASDTMADMVKTLQDAIGEAKLADIFGIEALGEAVTHYIAMITAPFIFMLLYIVISIVVSIIVGIIMRLVPVFKKKSKKPLHRLGGLGMGILCGILASLLVLMPIVGVLNIAVSVGKSGVLESEDGAADDELDINTILAEASEDQILAIYSASSGWIFDSLASTTFNGQKVYLKDEIEIIISAVGKLSELSGDASEFTEEQMNSIDEAFDEINRSPILSTAVADIVSTMASDWLEGESFIGIQKLDAGEMFNPIIDTILIDLAQTNSEYVVEDIKTLTGILRVLARHGMLANTDDFNGMLDTLSDSKVISELMDAATANERMSNIADQITQLSIRALASSIGIPSGANERYDLLMGEIADILNESRSMGESERGTYVEDEVAVALDRYGVVVSGQASSYIASSIINDLGSKQDLEGSDISEFFMIYAIASESAPSDGASRGTAYLASEEPALKLTVNRDGTVSVNGVVLRNYNSSNYGTSAAYTMGHNHASFGEAATLYSASSMTSSIITLDELLSCLKSYADCSDKELAIDNLASMMSEAVKLTDLDFDDMSKTEILDKLSDLLDIMKDAEIFKEVTPGILKAIFQTDAVRDAFNHDITQINSLADSYNATAQKTSYGAATATVSKGLDTFDKLNDPNATKEEKTAATKELMNDMTPENAEFLSTLTTPSMMKDYVDDDNKAETVSSSVTNLFNNMADYKANNPGATDADFDREADAVNTVLNLAMDSANSDKTSLFNTEHGDSTGKVDATAYEYVELIVTSDVTSSTLSQTLEENPDNPYGVNPTDEDEQQLSEALVEYYNNNAVGDDAELINRLNDVARFTNITPPEFNR